MEGESNIVQETSSEVVAQESKPKKRGRPPGFGEGLSKAIFFRVKPEELDELILKTGRRISPSVRLAITEYNRNH